MTATSEALADIYDAEAEFLIAIDKIVDEMDVGGEGHDRLTKLLVNTFIEMNGILSMAALDEAASRVLDEGH